MRTDKEFERLVTESVLSSEEKKALFEKVLPTGSAYFMNFLKTLADRGRENELMDMFPEFERGYKERKNILEAEAVTAVEMTPEQVEKITEELAEKYGKTPAQVLLRFLTQKGIAVIPRSTQPEHIRENFALFDFKLTADELAQLSALDKKEPLIGKPETPELVEFSLTW